MSDPLARFSQFDLDRLVDESFAASIDFHETLDSTSDRAIKLAQHEALELPALVLTNDQTAGRGRGSNRWLAATGSLTFSLIIDSDAMGIAPDALPQTSLVTAIALREALAAREPWATFYLKWPNDLYASKSGDEPKKVAGILLERPPNASNRLVIGIGVNVNNSHVAAPDEVRRRATSLCELSASEHTLCDVLLATLHETESMFALLARGDMRLPELWHSHCMLRGRQITAASGTRDVSGQCAGIDADGALLIETSSGLERLFSATIEQM